MKIKKIDMDIIKKSFDEHRVVLDGLNSQVDDIESVIQQCKRVLDSNNKFMFCGNGGSAADSQHLAAEFTGRFLKKVQPLPAIALTTDTSALTAIGNDFSFEEVFSRQVSALGHKGDLLFAISTSGNSKNIIRAVNIAKEEGIFTVAFIGYDGGELGKIADLSIIIDSSFTARIQEMHILVGHIICEALDKKREF
jgi:D-sedoheptulose 7-phosphate isomerase|tara:strand:+ start:199 stop:783 length:585 start_codon:yes stop_codon:yes gene_type:complete